MPLRWRQLEVRLTGSAGRVVCEPGWRLGPEWSKRLTDFDLWYVFGGRGTMQLAGGTVPLRPGVCFWARPGGTYLGEQDPRQRLGVSFIHFELIGPDGTRYRDGESLARADLGTLPPEHHVVHDAGYGDAVLRRVVELVRPHGPRDPAARRTAEALLRGVLMDLDRQASAQPGDALRGTGRRHQRLALAAAAQIDEAPGDCPPITELARRAGYSLDHFTRLFKQHVGVSPQAYLVRARIDRARQLLYESELTIGQIADALGYADVYFFSRQFKQKTGRTPTAYRAAPHDHGF